MKKSPLLLVLFMIPGFYAISQNVGIGTTTPSAKLTVTGSETSSEGTGAAIKLQNNSSSNAWYLRAGAPGTTTPAHGFSIGDNAAYHFTITPGGNTGLGINIPSAKLHVNGKVKIEGINELELGAGIAGKEINAGKIVYNGFGSGALEIVGAGTNSSNRGVYFFAEGGTVFSGPIDVRGNIRVNGNTGSAGQVLTSNGAGDPVWSNSAYNNTTRFGVTFGTSTAGAGTMDVTATIYNLNTSDVAIGTSSITINKTGLYKISGVVSGSVSYPGAAPAWEPELESFIQLNGPLLDIILLANFDHFARRSSVGNANYYLSKTFSLDMHLRTGTVITMRKSFHWDGSPSGHSAVVRIYGNLIAE